MHSTDGDDEFQDPALARIFEHFSDEAPLELQVLKSHGRYREEKQLF